MHSNCVASKGSEQVYLLPRMTKCLWSWICLQAWSSRCLAKVMRYSIAVASSGGRTRRYAREPRKNRLRFVQIALKCVRWYF